MNTRAQVCRMAAATILGAALVAAIAPAAQAGAAGMADATASRAFDEVKPAVVRVVTVTSEQVAVHLWILNPDALNAFLDADLAKLVGPTNSGPAVLDRAFEDAVAKFKSDPASLLKATPKVFRTLVSSKVVGSGTIVDGAGTVVTSAALTPAGEQRRSALKARVMKDLTAQLDDYLAGVTTTTFFADAPDIAAVLSAPVKQDVVDAVKAANDKVSTGQLFYEQESTTTTVQVGPAPDPFPDDPSTSDGPSTNNGSAGTAPSQTTVAFRSATPASGPPASGVGNYTATVAYRPQAGQQPVAVLTIPAQNLPAAPLAATGPADGQQLVVAGYGATRADGADIIGLVRPQRVSGAVQVTGTEPDVAHIPFSVGQSGGPALDSTGAVRGVAIMDGAKTEIIGVEQVAAALASAHRTAAIRADDGMWRTAITDGSHQWFKRSVPVLKALQGRSPSYPYVADLIDSFNRSIAAGRDRTPHSLPEVLVVLAALMVVAAGAASVRAVGKPSTA